MRLVILFKSNQQLPRKYNPITCSKVEVIDPASGFRSRFLVQFASRKIIIIMLLLVSLCYHGLVLLAMIWFWNCVWFSNDCEEHTYNKCMGIPSGWCNSVTIARSTTVIYNNEKFNYTYFAATWYEGYEPIIMYCTSSTCSPDSKITITITKSSIILTLLLPGTKDMSQLSCITQAQHAFRFLWETITLSGEQQKEIVVKKSYKINTLSLNKVVY